MSSRKAATERFADTLCQLQGSKGVARKLLSLTSDPDFKIGEVVACLEADPSLAAKILRVVNSSRYGLRHKVASVRQASALLGQRSLRLLAVSFSLMDGLATGPAAPMLVRHGRRSVLMAAAAARLAKHCPGVADDETYTAGLLSDVGVLILAQYQPKSYLPTWETSLHGPDLISAELELFDVTHAELGSRFLSRWGLPAAVVQAVSIHHAELDAVVPENEAVCAKSEARSLAGVLRTADLLAGAIAEQSPAAADAVAVRLRELYGVADPRHLASTVLADVVESAESLNLPASESAVEQSLKVFYTETAA